MEFSNYIRKPFMVQAVEITPENMEEVAKLIGTVKTRGDVTYIALDRRVVPNVGKAQAGWYLTIFGDNYRAYSPKAFAEQFIEHAPATGYFFDEEGQLGVDPASSFGIERPALDDSDEDNEETEAEGSGVTPDVGAFDVV